MAHAYVASIEEELKCCVCFKLFIDPHTPKDLNCPHVICELCLKLRVKDSAIDCPQCRVITRVSKDGVGTLKTNLGIRNLAEKHQKYLQKQEHQSHPLLQSRTQDDQVPVCSDQVRAVPEVTTSHNFTARYKAALMDKIKATAANSDEGLVQYQPGQWTQRNVKERNTVGLVRKIQETAKLEGFTMTIRSMASNRSGDILAISESVNSVYIYCKQSNGQYKKQSSLNVTGSQFDCDCDCYVAIAADGKYLVAKYRSIYVYSTSGQYQHVCYTAPAHTNTNELRLSCITTTKDGRIIAGDYDRSVITVHTPNCNKLLKTFNTSIMSIKPSRITAINNTHVAISADKVCVMDLKSGKETLRIIDIYMPLSVCYDEETGCLLISGCLGEIDQYSLLTGHKLACIAQDVMNPSVMIFTDDGMLAVGDDKTVKLYKASVIAL